MNEKRVARELVKLAKELGAERQAKVDTMRLKDAADAIDDAVDHLEAFQGTADRRRASRVEKWVNTLLDVQRAIIKDAEA